MHPIGLPTTCDIPIMITLGNLLRHVAPNENRRRPPIHSLDHYIVILADVEPQYISFVPFSQDTKRGSCMLNIKSKVTALAWIHLHEADVI